MLDILAALVEEMFGTGKQAQPRRVVRQDGGAAPGRSQGQASRPRVPENREERAQQEQFNDLVRQFFGIPGEEDREFAEEEAPPPSPPPSPRPSSPPARSGSRAAVVEAAPLPDLGDAPQTEKAARTDLNNGPSGSELAGRLRKNPAAARTAFIYSEILGPPKADKF